MTQISRLATQGYEPTLISPPGYEVISETGIATEIIPRGALCVLGASGWSLAPTGTKLADGIAAKNYVANQDNCEFIVDGEIEGYELTGGGALTPGTFLYPSASVAGGMATDVVTWYGVATTPAVAVPLQPQIKVTGPNRIRVRF